MSHHSLDTAIREKLSQLPATTAPEGSWDALADRLDAEQLSPLADKLAAVTPAAAPLGSWDELAAKLDARNANELDQTVNQALEAAAPAAVSGWSALAARLELIGRRREMVGCLKITEAALLMSLVLLLLRFGDFTSKRSIAIQDFPIVAQAEIPPADRPIEAPASVATPVSTTGSFETERTVIQPVPALESPTVRSLSTLPLPKVSDEPTASIPTLTYPAPEIDHPGPRPAVHLETLPIDEPVRTYLNAYVSPVDINRAITPSNTLLGIEADDRLTWGKSVGILVDFNQGKNGLQTGIIYGHRSYRPKTLRDLNPEERPFFRQRGYSRFVFNTITIPLNYERDLYRSTDWRFAGRFGFGMNVIVASEFFLAPGEDLNTLEEIIRRNAPSGGARGASSSISRLLNPRDGFFEGGGLLANSSFFLNGGLLLERTLNDRLSLYFSPSVSRAVYLKENSNGKGPFNDRIHNASFRVGGRMRIGKE